MVSLESFSSGLVSKSCSQTTPWMAKLLSVPAPESPGSLRHPGQEGLGSVHPRLLWPGGWCSRLGILGRLAVTGLCQTLWLWGHVGGTLQQAKKCLTQSILIRVSPTLCSELPRPGPRCLVSHRHIATKQFLVLQSVPRNPSRLVPNR